MNKKILKAAICAAVTVAFTVPAFANPFNDVPKNHWAYDAVNKLAAAGIVDGYGDGTYKGDKTMTRYEMAQIVSKAMGKVSTVEEKVVVDKLASEFSKELNDLGVKVDGIQKQLDDQIKFSGEARVQYTDVPAVGADETQYRFRLGATGKINDDTKINVRLATETGSVDSFSTVAIDRFNVSTDLLGMDIIAGKQDLFLGKGMLYDTDMTGVVANIGKLTVAVDNTGVDKFDAVEYKGNIFGKAFTADYLNQKDGEEFAALSTDFNFVGKKIGTEYIRNLSTDAEAFKVGTDILGLGVNYYDIEAGATPATTTLGHFDRVAGDKGFEVVYNKDIAKNTNLEIKYQDSDVKGDRTEVNLTAKF